MAAMENNLTGGPRMFATMQADQLNATTGSLANADQQLAGLMNKHGARKFWAAVKSQGLEPEDIDMAARKDQIQVDSNVPEAGVAQIKAHRGKIWEDLRQSRMRDVETALEGLNDDVHSTSADKIRRYWKCEKGINPVTQADLPSVDQLGGMEKFNEMQAKTQAKVKAEQVRKATALGMDFLMEKKQREVADAKVAAFEKRIAEYKKEQAETWKQKKILAEKATEKRQGDAAKAAAVRAKWEDETEAELWDRFSGARARRAHKYSPEGLRAKLEANKAKRMAAFDQATLLEEQLLETLEDRRIACEERLEVRRQEVEERLANQRAASQASFQKRQVVIHAKTTEWVENKLSEHAKFKQHVDDSRDQYEKNLKEKSKSTGDIRKKATDKVNTIKERIRKETGQSNSDLMERHAAADERREILNGMRFKNENDIYTYREMKHHTFGELVNRRNTEIKRRNDAQQQASIYGIAERKAASAAQDIGKMNIRKCRAEISKQSLTLMDKAAEGFLKIQSEPDENKVIATMNAMGFDMPVLPKTDEEEGGEGEKGAF